MVIGGILSPYSGKRGTTSKFLDGIPNGPIIIEVREAGKWTTLHSKTSGGSTCSLRWSIISGLLTGGHHGMQRKGTW